MSDPSPDGIADNAEVLPSQWDEHQTRSMSKQVRIVPDLLVQPKIRLTDSGTNLLTILTCFLSFKTVVTSQDIIVFKINFSLQKKDHLNKFLSG